MMCPGMGGVSTNHNKQGPFPMPRVHFLFIMFSPHFFSFVLNGPFLYSINVVQYLAITRVILTVICGVLGLASHETYYICSKMKATINVSPNVYISVNSMMVYQVV